MTSDMYCTSNCILFSDEFFSGFHLEASSSYFIRDCIDLNETEQEDVKAQFAEVLNNNRVCMGRSRKMCDVNDIVIICKQGGLLNTEVIDECRKGRVAHGDRCGKYDC